MEGNPMLRMGRVKFKGKSGNIYSFLIYPRGTGFKKGLGAVYCVTNRYLKKDRSYVHGAIYAGHTADLSTEFDDHPRQSCFDEYGGNCVCVREELDRDIRAQVVQDLTDNYNPPCNKEKEQS
jgi:hypothetical protein